jgi:heme-degrading monooxygenase HmoA
MQHAYTHTMWVVRPEQETEFVRRWQDWAQWSQNAGLQAHAILLRDVDNPMIHMSFGRWESLSAVRDWRLLTGYHERVKALGGVVQEFEPRTLTVVRHG